MVDVFNRFGLVGLDGSDRWCLLLGLGLALFLFSTKYELGQTM